MNISYNWLKEIVDIDLSPEETAKALTRVGLAVEGIHGHKGDHVLDIDITSNRSDCLSHLGIARELGAATGRPLISRTGSAATVPLPSVLAGDTVRIEAPDLCHRFTARLIRNVSIGPSPSWLVDRLESLGERSINNVADITNYVMLELGQPMHAFDLDKLQGQRIVVRPARPGESIKTLDEVDRELDESILAVCDTEKPVAIAGIMGGFDSGITAETRNVLLEVAYFDRDSIRAASRKLRLSTEASYRFERGVDILNVVTASERAAQLICDLAGGEEAEFLDMFPRAYMPPEVRSANISAATQRLSGVQVSSERCDVLLSSIGVERTESNDAAIYSPPSWRHDIAIEEDLVEEIVRLNGYENIESVLPPAFGAGEHLRSETILRRVRSVLEGFGFSEAITYSFIDEKYDSRFQPLPSVLPISDLPEPERLVTLRDSVIEGAVRMRPTLLPGLLEAVRHNFNQSERNILLFESGKAFAKADTPGEAPAERLLLSFVMTGSMPLEGRASLGRAYDLYDAIGIAEAVLEAAGVTGCIFRPVELVHLRSGRAAKIAKDGVEIGSVGQLADALADESKFRQPVFVCEIDLDGLISRENSPPAYRPLPRFPSVVRDVSFVVKRQQRYADIEAAAKMAGQAICRSVKFVDDFVGSGLAEDERSLTVRFEYRSDDRTLTEDEVEVIHQAVLASIIQNAQVTMRM